MSETLSILVVDDYQPLASSLAKVLDLKGFEVQTAYSGSEALHILEAHPVDILLTDVRMPDMSGLELYRETKRIHIPLTAILMTAYAPEDLLQQGMEEGVRAVLDKPVDLNFLFALISTFKDTKTHEQIPTPDGVIHGATRKLTVKVTPKSAPSRKVTRSGTVQRTATTAKASIVRH